MANSAPTIDRIHIRPGDRICAAISGGADSVAMLLLLHAANALPRNSLGVGLSAVHVHHGLRGEEADGDLAFVQELCARLEVPLHIQRADVPGRVARSREEGEPESIEEAARVVRYEFFEQLIADGRADSVLTAHTLDDQAETVLMKLLRGAWTEGLSGIYPVVLVRNAAHPGKILRPLLGVRRVELIAYLESRNQGWRTDSTNADEAFTRNRVRHSMLPYLRDFNPAVDQALANLAELAREDESRWQSELGRILPQLLLPGRPVRGGGRGVSTAPGAPNSVAIEIDRLRSLDPAMRRRVVRAAARQLGVRLSFDETARLLILAGLLSNSNNGASIVAARNGSLLHLAGQLRAQRTPRELRLFREPQLKSPKNI
ncbi:MAG TPA: tRNA lysidine(34) synthetase TilS [Acidobacteriaceae bacterium]|jgi:tRNA(Ile)-lysidine synthase|nr:tRNA lysidine(34) synthetase TilS [Acidobacteriaceae bacterium]